MSRKSRSFVNWAVVGLVITLALGTIGRAAEAAVGDVIKTVTIPGDANCGSDFGTALAVVSGGKAGFPAIPSLVVISCFTPSDGSSQSRLFLLDPVTSNPSATSAVLKTTISTSVVTPWNALAFRADTGDLLGCTAVSSTFLSSLSIASAQTTPGRGDLYVLHFSPFDPAGAPGTATPLFTGSAGSNCNGIAWDSKNKTIYQTSSSPNILHLTPTGAAAVPATIASGCTTPVAGIGIAGVSLFVACAAPSGGVPTIRQLDKASGSLVRSFSVTLPAGMTMVDPAGVPDDPASFGLQVPMRDVLWTKDAVSSTSTTFGQLIGLEMAAGTTGQNSGAPLAFPAACDQTTGSAPDADGDGLLDCWEDSTFWSDGRPGISVDSIYSANRDPSFRAVTLCVDMNGNGVFDAGECASPNHKDIFVEADYMQFHRPDPVAVNNVVTAFANAPVANPDGTTGIRLHVQIDDQLTDGSGNPLHTLNTALVPCTPPGAAGVDADFDALKASFFGTAAERAAPNAAALLSWKRFAYHYVAFVHNQKGSTSSGCAEILGNDFMVSLGSFAQVPVGGHNVGTTDQQAGTFMHELGHNLGLRHGGFENVNCKPNYTSRMNYAYQFNSPVNPFPLDYSRQTLLTLNEASLAESAGIGGYSGNIAFGPPTGIPARLKVASGAGAINWNLNTTTDPNVVRDLNKFGIAGCPDSPGETLAGFDDWAHINFNFRASVDFGDGAHTFETPEITSDDARTISVDTDGDGIADFDDNCPLTRNPSQNADACTVVIKTFLVPRETARREDLDDDLRPFIVAVIFSSVTRDATMLDPASILITGASAQGSGIWSRHVFQAFGHFVCGRFDVNRDGRADLVCVFKASAKLLPVGVSNVVLDAMTLGGEGVRGTDTITVRPADKF